MAVGGDGFMNALRAERITHGHDQMIVYSDGKCAFYRLLDINKIFDGHFERYTNAFFLLEQREIRNSINQNKITVISENDLLETADELYKDVLDGDKRNYKNLIRRITRLTDFVIYAREYIENNKSRKQQFTDRKICAKCRFSYFENDGKHFKFKWCNYCEYTGNKRPHNGCECYGFEAK